MSAVEIIQAAEFLVDAAGNRKAAVLDWPIWEELVKLLADLAEEDEDRRTAVEISARIARGEEPLYTHDQVWAELDALEAQGELPA